ncbi:hypothetical protein B296_00013994 [Ensete ventricosum]|uniref:DNA polymerase delta small subunit n=1 Tax=Ensete ventricosum TaxID=4639 RepID=A0A426ZCC8_ENSVE|nr:hypothetical protein B296_00013994 [Ensete ventricosum]
MKVDVEMGGGSPKLLERKQAVYRNLVFSDPYSSRGYEIHGEKYKGQQYSHIYFTRLHYMRNLLYSLVPKFYHILSFAFLFFAVNTVLGLEDEKECIIAGTMYKHMKLKPSILDEYSKERSKVPLVKPHNFVHPDDHLILEDESGRVKLAGSLLDPSAFVTGVLPLTGIVVALHGKETSEGKFFVLDMLEAGLPPQIEQPPSSSDENEQTIASQIVHFIIAGNSVQILQGLLNACFLRAFLYQTIAPRDQAALTEPIKELDILLNQLAAAMPVDIMPGPSDPANFSLPQQPLIRCLFPGASAYNTFISCTNPHQFELDDIRFLGTSGQNIDDLFKYSEAKNKLEFMERTLRWRHLVPTAPNTLGCYPFTDKDPFLIESCPHVYFVGNQDKFETTLLRGLSPQVLETFATLVYFEVKRLKVEKGVLECAVCLSKFEDDEEICFLSCCNHIFS